MAGFERFLSVRERALRALESTLLDITHNNGYNTEIRSVTRTRKIPDHPDSPPEIFLMPDQSTVLWRGTHHKFERIPVDIWFVCEAENGQDYEFNMLLCDIQRVLSCGIIVDQTYPVENWAQIYVIEDPSTPLYTSEQSGFMMGVVRYTIEFWRHYSDPRLWDNQDIMVSANE